MPTIVPKDAADRERLRKALLSAAGDQPDRVKYSTAGPELAFDVDDELVAAISKPTEPEPARPTKAPAKKAAPKVAAKPNNK